MIDLIGWIEAIAYDGHIELEHRESLERLVEVLERVEQLSDAWVRFSEDEE